MIAACLTAAAALPAFLCTPGGEPPPPPPARIVNIDRQALLAAVLPPDIEPETVPEPWHSLAVCESGMNGVPRWDYNGGSGFDGGLQHSPGTWTAFKPDGYPDFAWQATPEQQVAVATRVQAEQGWNAWPSCSRKLGLID